MRSNNNIGLGRRDVLAMGAAGSALIASSGALAQASPQSAVNPASTGEASSLLPLPDYAALRRERVAQLDPEMREIYDRALATPGLRKLGVPRIRSATKNPAAAKLAEGVTAHNINIPGPAGNIPTRVYMPAAANGPVGVYLSTHGGGWLFGEGLEYIDAGESQNVLDWGCAVVHPDYRISPENKFPAAIDDCYATLKYIVQNGSKMGIDTTRIGVGGGCTGANLATVISLMARDEGIQMPAIQWLWSPCFDTRNDYKSYYEFADGYGLRRDDSRFAESLYLRSEEDRFDWRASPILAKTMRGAPPALIWVGEWEILNDESHQYAQRMRDAGCTVHFIEGKQQGHGFIYLHRNTKYARETLPKINEIMRRYIGPEAAKRKPERSPRG